MPIDPSLASRLRDVLALLEQGYTLDEASNRAALPRAEIVRYFDSLRRDLPAGAGPDREPRGVPKKKAGHRVDTVLAYADGGSRGNPGRAACAVILYGTDKEELVRRYRLLGRATNNVAEYEGVLLALELCAQLRAKSVRLHLDSELVVRQIQGSYKVRHADLKPLHARVQEAVRGFESFSVTHVPRKDNAEADRLVNAALDGKAEPGEEAR